MQQFALTKVSAQTSVFHPTLCRPVNIWKSKIRTLYHCSKPHPHPVDQSFLSNPVGSLDTENLGKRKIEAHWLCIAFLTEIHKLFIWMVQTVLNNTSKTSIFTGWNLRKSGCQYQPLLIKMHHLLITELAIKIRFVQLDFSYNYKTLLSATIFKLSWVKGGTHLKSCLV